MAQTKKTVDDANDYSEKHIGSPIIHLTSWKIRKEELARKQQETAGIASGLIGVWSCLETGWLYRAHFCDKTGYPVLRSYRAQFKHLYFYFDDPQFGFMNIRLQTWFPYHIQVRLRHWCNRNSVKVYNEKNKLRVETAINEPDQFKVFPHKQGQDE